jgi:hypothetical protein
LFEAGALPVAVENVVRCLDCGQVGRLAGKQVAVAGLRIEQREQFVEVARGRGLVGRLAVAVEVERRGERRGLDAAADRRDTAERLLCDVEADADLCDRTVVGVERGELRA